ncbi:MAG TPA: hypothetical protein VKZ43_05765, partial [Trueperaceae bacterium]|nr:hypothetical protein [Trueperaceae bacterium]
MRQPRVMTRRYGPVWSPRRALRALPLWLLVALTAATATAQGTPSIALDAFTYTQGESLRLTGRGLVPNEQYTLTLSPPSEAGTPRQSQVRSSAFGNLSRTEPLDLPGVWTVELVGPEMNAQLRITVNPDPTGPPIGAPQAPGSQQEPQQQQGEQQATDAPPTREQDQQDAGGQVPGPDDAAEQNDGLPQVATPEPSPQVPAAGLPTASLRDGDVVGVLEAREVWRLSFGPDSGGTSGLLQLDDRVLVGHGNHVLVVDANTGVVAQRFRMPARVA